MENFKEFLDSIPDAAQKQRTTEVLTHIRRQFPQLATRIAWGQPSFTDHGTFIIAFSLSRAHLALAPETKALRVLGQDIRDAGYETTKMLVKLPWNKPIDYALIDKIVAYNIEDKKNINTYWRPKEEW